MVSQLSNQLYPASTDIIKMQEDHHRSFLVVFGAFERGSKIGKQLLKIY
jgi:hypothetical protein